MSDLLQFVRSELNNSVGDLNRVAKQSGIAYDTVLRIKNCEGDPGYSKVKRLAEYFQSQQKQAA